MRVEPIRSTDQIRRIIEALRQDRSQTGRRRYLLFVTGIYLGRRISDLLKLKVGDVKDKTKVVIREKKTRKQAEMYIDGQLRRIFREELADRDPEEWLFQSPTPDRITRKSKPVDRRTAYRDIQVIARIGGFPSDYNLGTHTLRKTFGYHYYQQTHDIAGLMDLFNHSKEETTLIYIGIASDERKRAFRSISRMYDS